MDFIYDVFKVLGIIAAAYVTAYFVGLGLKHSLLNNLKISVNTVRWRERE